MLYLIEGVDGVGKSTIINNMIKKFGGITIHADAPSGRMLEIPNNYSKNFNLALTQDRYFSDMMLLLENSSYQYLNLYMDRFHLGEYVYFKYRELLEHDANVYNRNTVFEKIDRLLFEKLNKWTKLVLLYFPKYGFTFRHKDNENPYDEDRIKEDQEDFIYAFKQSKLRNKVMIEVTDENGFYPIEELIGNII